MTDSSGHAAMMALMELLRTLDTSPSSPAIPLIEHYGDAGARAIASAILRWREAGYPMPDGDPVPPPTPISPRDPSVGSVEVRVRVLTRLMHRLYTLDLDDLAAIGPDGLSVLATVIAEAIDAEVES